jgi:hypothetical protein
MALQFAVLTRDARLNAIETEIGTDPILKLRGGAPPANCAAADSGTVFCEITLPTDWLAAASSGAKAKAGTWSGTAVGGGGTIAHFRIYVGPAGTVAKIQGTVTITGGGGNMTADNPVVADGQAITVTGFTITDGNA